MTILKETKQYKVDSEKEAVSMIEEKKEKALTEVYSITKASYTRKTKKDKELGEVEAFLVEIQYTYGKFWEA